MTVLGQRFTRLVLRAILQPTGTMALRDPSSGPALAMLGTLHSPGPSGSLIKAGLGIFY